MYPVYKQAESRPEVAFYYLFKFQRLSLYLQLLESFTFEYFQSVPFWPKTVLIIWDIQSVYVERLVHF